MPCPRLCTSTTLYNVPVNCMPHYPLYGERWGNKAGFTWFDFKNMLGGGGGRKWHPHLLLLNNWLCMCFSLGCALYRSRMTVCCIKARWCLDKITLYVMFLYHCFSSVKILSYARLKPPPETPSWSEGLILQYKVKLLNSRHIGSRTLVRCREVVPISDVD